MFGTEPPPPPGGEDPGIFGSGYGSSSYGSYGSSDSYHEYEDVSPPETNPEPQQIGDLYDSAMGPLSLDGIRGGIIQFNYRPTLKDGPDCTHHSVFGEDRHFSWDEYPEGDPRNEDRGPRAHGRLHKPDQEW